MKLLTPTMSRLVSILNSQYQLCLPIELLYYSTELERYLLVHEDHKPHKVTYAFEIKAAC